MKTYLLIAAAAIIQPAASLAQTTAAGAGFQQVDTVLGSGGGVITVQAGGRGGRGGQLMIGKPYSATAVTHTVQMLADGSQIERTQSEVFYRDEQGRTRTETNEGKFVQIVDRVAGFTYSLDTAAKTARATEIMTGGRRGANASVTQTQAIEDLKAMADKLKAAQEQSASAQAKGAPNLATEDLGTQFINGVQAKGARTTSTIPVGAIGNNRELKTVSERWESKDLGLLVKSVNSDPRFGTTTYELTNISQSAPDPSLFRVPGDYTVLQPRN
jgi:hypothetical protein